MKESYRVDMYVLGEIVKGGKVFDNFDDALEVCNMLEEIHQINGFDAEVYIEFLHLL